VTKCPCETLAPCARTSLIRKDKCGRLSIKIVEAELPLLSFYIGEKFVPLALGLPQLRAQVRIFAPKVIDVGDEPTDHQKRQGAKEHVSLLLELRFNFIDQGLDGLVFGLQLLGLQDRPHDEDDEEETSRPGEDDAGPELGCPLGQPVDEHQCAHHGEEGQDGSIHPFRLHVHGNLSFSKITKLKSGIAFASFIIRCTYYLILYTFL